MTFARYKQEIFKLCLPKVFVLAMLPKHVNLMTICGVIYTAGIVLASSNLKEFTLKQLIAIIASVVALSAFAVDHTASDIAKADATKAAVAKTQKKSERQPSKSNAPAAKGTTAPASASAKADTKPTGK